MFSRPLACALSMSLITAGGVIAGCASSSPSPSPPTVSTPSPVGAPSGSLSITAIVPAIGSTRGTNVTITGSGFRRGAIVTLGGVAIRVCAVPTTDCSWVSTSTTLYASAPPHAAGRVDVVVTNTDGQAGRLPEGYTYAIPESFEVNGNWEGGADSDYGTPFRFTVRNDTLTDISCGASGILTLSPPLPISQGAFSFDGPDGANISGRIVSPNSAVGNINMSPCFGFPWFAERHE